MRPTDRLKSGNPKRCEAALDYRLESRIALQQLACPAESVEAADGFRRDRRIIIGQISRHDAGDQIGLARRKQFAADLGRKRHVGLQGFLRGDNGTNGSGSSFGCFRDQPTRGEFLSLVRQPSNTL